MSGAADTGGGRGGGPGERGRREHDARVGIFQDEGQFARMEFGVDWHRDQPGVPARVHEFGAGGGVSEKEADTIAGHEAQLLRQTAGESSDAVGQLRPRCHHVFSDRQGRRIAMRDGVPGKVRGQIHARAERCYR